MGLVNLQILIKRVTFIIITIFLLLTIVTSITIIKGKDLLTDNVTTIEQLDIFKEMGRSVLISKGLYLDLVHSGGEGALEIVNRIKEYGNQYQKM